MSHYIPSPEHYSLVYYVNLFYKFFIPLVLGGMVALVGMDLGHTFFVRFRRGKPHHQPNQPETEATSVTESLPQTFTSETEAPPLPESLPQRHTPDTEAPQLPEPPSPPPLVEQDREHYGEEEPHE
jgi:hypothetical protein